MSSATAISNLESASSSTSHDKAAQWAEKIRSQLRLVAPYDDVDKDEYIPASITVDETIMEAPRRRSADPEAAALANNIAQMLYPGAPEHSLSSLIKYEKDIVKLRNLVIKQRKHVIDDATKRNELMNWDKRILKQGPWDPVTNPMSLDGAPSLPMPVKIANPSTLAPFFEHLSLNGTEEKSSSTRAAEEGIEIEEPYYNVKSLEFEKGVLYSDGRMDLCKMVLGPTNIGDLIESLKTNTFITHFLLGNNIIGPHGAQCIVDFLKEFPNRMDTWYLAGNCIDTASFKILVDEWVKSTSVTNIWLKRNPLKPAAANDLFRLITQTPHLRTLDLDQTELGDAGVAELFTKLALHAPEKPLSIRHIYLNAVGIGPKAAVAIGEFLASPHCKLDAIYATNNPLGNEGVAALAAGLKENKSLARLTLASTGMGDDGATALCEALENHPTMAVLELSQHFATQDLDARYNWITDRSTHAIHNLLISSTPMAYLGLGQCALTHTGLNTILEAVIASPTLLYYIGKTIYPQDRTAAAIKAGQEHVRLSKLARATLEKNVKGVYGDQMNYDEFHADQKRWLINDKTDVRKIDSVYRNRDAGLARRGLMKLDKWWDEDDETLREVMNNAVGPVCTTRRNKAKVEGAVGPVCTKRQGKAEA
ncbi:RNI-like protein [Lentithecium fluviatile CBS 122367]|uniref:RNI-like protein n=1 Tax=Lentithecium fluviatile CBS 122367 TaxID=1168545 RepID=A0A6G1IWE4_9PLEO|nr:RNI-like protein [Lentithecium fluviatile CBS 122367]